MFYLKALNALAGTKFKIIQGFPGGGETELAMQRGEVEGNSKAWASMKVDNAEWLKEKKVNMLLQYGLERSPDLPDVPLHGRARRTDAGGRAALKLFAMGNAMGRSIMATPGVPAERMAALQKAFMDTMNDPELIAFAKERHIDFGPPLDGKGWRRSWRETLAVSPATVAMVKKARGEVAPLGPSAAPQGARWRSSQRLRGRAFAL